MNKIYTLKSMTKSKLILIILLQCVFSVCTYGQAILVFNENFETGGGTFTLNASGQEGSNTGSNQWIVNNIYFPAINTIPATKDENTICSTGNISSAPFGHYLHISNSGIQSNLNSDYDPSQASDRFAFMTNGVCTMGMDSVTLAFFYNVEGSSTDYGEVYYSVNNGPWVQTGQPQYNNDSSCWQYATIMNPAFNNVSSLQIGFRWVNTSSGSAPVQAFGIDDIFIVGNPRSNITDSITNISPNPVCQNSDVFFTVNLSDTLCEGTYEIELSDGTGNFNNLSANYVFTMGNPQVNVFEGIPIGSLPLDSCYRIRVVRLSPPPVFIGEPSPCIIVQACPDYIYTQQPVVTMDTNAVCVGSVIDIPFYSYGTYNPGNNYIGELSDSAGNFLSMTIINTNFNDPNPHPGPPGTVSGLVPDVPDGCNYYVRVVGTNPDSTVGVPWGPFCIQHCDINTNEHISLHFCLTPNTTVIDTCLDVDVHTFHNDQVYLPGNKFEIQILSSMTFQLIGQTGMLGYQADTTDTLVCIHIDGLAGLAALGLAPGSYYLRVVATNTLYPDSSLGEVIHFTIGAPPDSGTSVVGLFYQTGDTIKPHHACPGDILEFLPNPIDYTAQYEWYGGFIGDSLSSIALLINIGGQFFDFITYVREISYGCRGPASSPDTVIIDGIPQVNISSPTFVCIHDTTQWIVPFGQNTYYDWTSPNGSVLDTSNNTIKIRFDSAGTYSLSVFALNHCGSATGTKLIHVINLPTILQRIDTTFCSYQEIKLETPTAQYYQFSWTNSSGTLSTTDSLTITSQVPDTIFLTVTQSQGHCMSFDTIILNVLQAQIANHLDSLCLGDTLSLNPTHTGVTYQWSNGATSIQLNVDTSGTYIAVVTSPDSLCAAIDTFHVSSVARIVTQLSDSICLGDTITLNAIANSGATFLWNSGAQTTQQIMVGQGGTYVAAIQYSDRVCINLDSFNVVQPPQVLNGHSDSLCPGDVLPLTATSGNGAAYFWNTGQTTQSINVMDTGIYYVYHSVPNQRCNDADTFHITWKNCAQMTVNNVFSPNGDGLNDFFVPHTVGVYDLFHIEIYDRWGLKMWESDDPDFHWPGINKSGNKCPDGTYYYIITTTYQNKNAEWHGYVTLIR